MQREVWCEEQQPHHRYPQQREMPYEHSPTMMQSVKLIRMYKSALDSTILSLQPTDTSPTALVAPGDEFVASFRCHLLPSAQHRQTGQGSGSRGRARGGRARKLLLRSKILFDGPSGNRSRLHDCSAHADSRPAPLSSVLLHAPTSSSFP